MECLLPYLSMVTVPHIMVGLERMLDYRGFTVPLYNKGRPEPYSVVELTYTVHLL